MKTYHVYIMSNHRNGTIYVGITNDLIRRVNEHKSDLIRGFTKTYHCHALVYFEEYNDVDKAIYREKQLKWWRRKWKIELIEEENPEWDDLYDNLVASRF